MDIWTTAGNAIPLDFSGPEDVTFERFDDEWIERPIVARFEHIARRYAGRTAVRDNEASLTYRELQHAAWALAQRIAAAAMPGQPVGILLPHDALFPLAALACLAAGVPYVPIDPKFPAERIADIIHEAGLSTVVVDTDTHRSLPAEVARIGIACAFEESDETFAPRKSAEHAAVILYTSGSSGKPKGICNKQNAVLQRVAEATNSCHVQCDDRFILLSSPGTIAGVREMFAALLNGATLHVTDPQRDGVRSVLKALRDSRITIAYSVPALLRMLLRAPGAKEAFSHLRVLRIGGDITLAADLALFREVAPPACHFFASFSSTESPAVFQWFVPPSWNADGPRVPVGYARPGTDFMLIDEDGRPVAPGEIGELVVRSRYLALGLWQEGRLLPGPFRNDPDDPALRVLHSGDLVRQRADGLWELIGRKDRQVKIRGQRVDMEEVEAVLRNCDGVTDAAVIARRNGEETVALVAFVARDAAADGALPAKIRRMLELRVPQQMRPADIHLLDRIPQLPGFKTDMRALHELDQRALARRLRHDAGNGAPQRPASPSGSRVREAVRSAWTAVLGSRSFDANLAWNAADGDSLKAMELWFHIEEKLGIRLALDDLDGDTTPSYLIERINARLLPATKRNDSNDSDVPTVFLMPGILGDEPLLAGFRAALGKEVRFKILEYPGWRQALATRGSFDTIVDSVFTQICAEPPCGLYRLAGYSFGGAIAFEAARRLIASGRRVGFVGLIDSRRWDVIFAHQPRRLRTLAREPARLHVAMLQWTLAALVRTRRFALLNAIARLALSRPSRFAFLFQRRLMEAIRQDALRQWKPQPLDAPTTLFLSESQWPGEPSDYGWNALCNALTVIHIGGTHATMMQPPKRDPLCAGFLQAIAAPASLISERGWAGVSST